MTDDHTCVIVRYICPTNILDMSEEQTLSQKVIPFNQIFCKEKKTLSLMHLVKIWHKFVQSCYILAWNPKILLPCTNGLVQKSASCVGGPCSLWVYSLLNINSYLIYKFYAIDDNIWRWKFFIIVHLWHDRQ